MKTNNLRTWVEIDRNALISNLRTFQKIIGDKIALMAVVKANAYGHGLALVAKLLAKSRIANRLPGGRQGKSRIWFGVDSIDEAIILRKSGIKNKILILGWIPESRLPETLKYDLSFVFYNIKPSLKILSKPYCVHIKIETGTNRQGIQLEDIAPLAKKLQGSRFKVEGIYTHFAESENPKSQFWNEQVAKLEKVKKIFENNGIFPEYVHCASTAAACLYPESHKNLVRLGIGLYGLWPSKEIKSKISRKAESRFAGQNPKSKIKLKPVLTWKTKIAQIKNVKRGETIGYARTYKAKNDMKIGVLPIGYYDGYDRRLSNIGEVLIKGRRAKILGRVCMNMIMVDVTKFQNLKVGDEVILLGGRKTNRVSAEEMAEKLNTINYEVVTRINPLIPRIVV